MILTKFLKMGVSDETVENYGIECIIDDLPFHTVIGTTENNQLVYSVKKIKQHYQDSYEREFFTEQINYNELQTYLNLMIGSLKNIIYDRFENSENPPILCEDHDVNNNIDSYLPKTIIGFWRL